MSLQIRRKSPFSVSMISTVIAVLALVVSPMYGVVSDNIASAESGDSGRTIWVDTWGNDRDGCGLTNGGGSGRGANCKTLQYAVEQAKAGDTVKLKTPISYTETVIVDKAITIDGRGLKINSNIQNTSKDNNSNAAIALRAPATLQNLVLNGTFGKNIHAINAWHTDGWATVSNVYAIHYDQSGVNVGERASVKVGNITVEDIKWSGINVDKADSQFWLGGGTSNHFNLSGNTPAIYIDDRSVPKEVRLDNPSLYVYVDNTKNLFGASENRTGDRAYYMASNYPDAIRNIDFTKPKATINIDKLVNPTAISFDASDNVGLSGYAFSLVEGDHYDGDKRIAQNKGNYMGHDSISGTAYSRNITNDFTARGSSGFTSITDLPDGVYTVHVQVLDNARTQNELRNQIIIDKTFTIDHTAPKILSGSVEKIKNNLTSVAMNTNGKLKLTIITDEELDGTQYAKLMKAGQDSNGNDTYTDLGTQIKHELQYQQNTSEGYEYIAYIDLNHPDLKGKTTEDLAIDMFVRDKADNHRFWLYRGTPDVYDNADNLNGTMRFTVDNATPKLKVNNIKDVTIGYDKPVVTGTTTDPDDTVMVNDKEEAKVSSTKNDDGTYDWRVELGVQANLGEVTVRVTSEDKALNKTEAERSFTVKNIAAPTISNVAASGSTVTVSGVNYAPAGSTVDVTLTNLDTLISVTFRDVPVGEFGAWTAVFTDVASGTYRAVAEATLNGYSNASEPKDVTVILLPTTETNDPDANQPSSRRDTRFSLLASPGFTTPLADPGAVLGDNDVAAADADGADELGDFNSDGVLGAEDDNGDSTGCFKLLGLCWYYWIPIVIIVAALITWWGVSRRRNNQLA